MRTFNRGGLTIRQGWATARAPQHFRGPQVIFMPIDHLTLKSRDVKGNDIPQFLVLPDLPHVSVTITTELTTNPIIQCVSCLTE